MKSTDYVWSQSGGHFSQALRTILHAEIQEYRQAPAHRCNVEEALRYSFDQPSIRLVRDMRKSSEDIYLLGNGSCRGGSRREATGWHARKNRGKESPA